MQNNIYIYMFIMAIVTSLVRVIPLMFFRKPIKSIFIKSFLFYMPYVTLSVMTFPAIVNVTGDITYGLIGFAAALLTAFCGGSLAITASVSCLAVFLFSFI